MAVPTAKPFLTLGLKRQLPFGFSNKDLLSPPFLRIPKFRAASSAPPRGREGDYKGLAQQGTRKLQKTVS